jgi:hypothetical protein
MALIEHVELIPQDENKLNHYLLNELRNNNNWRENAADSIEDQCTFYHSYFSKVNNAKLHIDKQILSQYLKENESVMKDTSTKYQESFLSLTHTYNDESNNENINLYHYTNSTHQFNTITLSSNEDNPIEVNDINEVNLNDDIHLRLISLKPTLNNSLRFCDLYNIYEMPHNSQKPKQVLQLEMIPNYFLSDQFINSYFVISSGNGLNWLSFINSTTNSIITQKKFENGNTYIGGEFLNKEDLCLVYNNNSILLCDFRSHVKQSEQLLFTNNTFAIQHVNYLDEFNYVSFSSQKLSLFDLRYPSLPLSEKHLNINYDNFTVKPLHKNIFNDIAKSTIAFDSSRHDMSHLVFDFKETEKDKTYFMNDFVDFALVKSDELLIEIHDIESFDLGQCDNENDNKKLYLNFIVDNLNGVYMNIYDMNEKNIGYTTENIANMIGKKFVDSVKVLNDNNNNKNIENDILNLYQKHIENSILVNKDEDDEIDFGTAIVNGKEKKMYQIENKRHLIQDSLNKDIDINIQKEEDNEDMNINLTEDEFDKIKFLIDEFNETKENNNNTQDNINNNNNFDYDME